MAPRKPPARKPSAKPRNAPSRLNSAQKKVNLTGDRKKIQAINKAAGRVMTGTKRKTAAAKKLGYGGDVAAMTAVSRQYGMVKNAAGQWVRPDMAFLVRQMESQGWGPKAQAGSFNEQGTPINIGGMRVFVGKNGIEFTGQRSDSAKRNPGASYLDPKSKQSSYSLRGRGKGKSGGRKSQVNPGGPGVGSPIGGGGGVGPGVGGQASPAGKFASGVSASSLEFIKELGTSRFAEGESEAGETGPTKNKKKKPAKKLVKRASKKAGVKRRVIRRAINTKGTSKKEQALYKSVGNPKLSSRLRAADKRINKKAPKKK